MNRRNVNLISILLFATVFVVFLPSLRNGFVNFDDNVYIYENPHVKLGLTWKNLAWAFTNFDAGFWQPLTWLSILVDRQLFGIGPAGFHFISILLHGLSAVILFRCLSRATGVVWLSAAVAGLFALHPLNVESVAWASSRKDVLSGFFWMLTLAMYFRYAENVKIPGRQKWWFYALAVLFFVAGLMSKAMVVTLPLILLLLDFWPLRRFEISSDKSRPGIGRKLLLEKVPFFLGALFCGLITLHAEKTVGALRTTVEFPMTYRLCNAPLSYGSYLFRAFWPVNLAVYYPPAKALPVWAAITLVALMAAVSVAAVWRRREQPYFWVGWIWFVLTLLPVIGVIQVGSHVRADRYTYIPLIGIFVTATWAVHACTRRLPARRMFLAALGITIGVGCFALTRQQLGYWKNSEALFQRALRVTANNAVIENALGGALAMENRYDEAIEHLQNAVSLAPGYWDARNNLGTALARKGRFDEALPHLAEAVRLAPESVEGHRGLADTLAAKGYANGAIAQYREVVRLAHGDAGAHDALGTALAQAGRLEEAIQQLRTALELNPLHAEAHCHLGIALGKANRVKEAIPELEEAVRLDPGLAEAHCNLGGALCAQAQWDAAITHLKRALDLKPAYQDAQRYLAAAMQLKAKAESQSPAGQNF